MKHIQLFEEYTDAEKKSYAFSFDVDDHRTPGGDAESILKNYGLVAEIYLDGTLMVQGAYDDIKRYLDDYGIFHRESQISHINGDPQWTSISK